MTSVSNGVGDTHPASDARGSLAGDLAKAISVLVQHWLVLVLVVTVAIGSALAYAVLRSAVYEVGAQLLVRVGTETVASPSVDLRTTNTMPVDIDVEDVNNEVQVMRDPVIMAEVVERLGEEFFFAERPPETFLQHVKAFAKGALQAVRDTIENVQVRLNLRERLTPMQKVTLLLQEFMEINAVPQSNIIELRLEIGDRESGEAILATFIDVYLERRRAIFEQREMATFFSGQLDPLEARLREIEADQLEAKRALGAFSVDEQRSLLLDERAALDKGVGEATVRIERLTRELGEIDRRLDVLPENVVAATVEGRSPLGDDARRRLLQLELDLEEATRAGGREGEEARTLRDQIGLLRARLDGEADFRIEQRTTGKNAVREDLLRERERIARALEGARAEIEGLRERGASVGGRLVTLEESGLQLARREREIDRLTAQRDRLTQALDASQVSEALAVARISNVVVAAPPRASLAPIWPRLSLLVAAAIILSVGATGLVLVLLELVRPKVRSRSDLAAALGLPPGGGGVAVKPLPNVRGLAT